MQSGHEMPYVLRQTALGTLHHGSGYFLEVALGREAAALAVEIPPVFACE